MTYKHEKYISPHSIKKNSTPKNETERRQDELWRVFFIEMETDDFSKKRGNFKQEAALQRKPIPRTERTAVFPILFLHVLFSAHPQDKTPCELQWGIYFFLLLVFALHNKPGYLWSIPRLVRWMSMMRTSQWCAHKWVKSWRIAHDAAVQGRDLTSVLHHWKGPIKQGRHQLCWLLRFDAHCIEDTPDICWVVMGEV